MNGVSSEILPLGCHTIVYRAVAAAGWLENPPDAFMLRPTEKDTGLSVSYNCTVDECRYTLAKSYGVLSLHTGRVRALNLDIIPDEPQHANITGLPYKEDDPLEAERLASLLAKQARMMERGLKKRPSGGLI
jgi:hypothetical protein